MKLDARKGPCFPSKLWGIIGSSLCPQLVGVLGLLLSDISTFRVFLSEKQPNASMIK